MDPWIPLVFLDFLGFLANGHGYLLSFGTELRPKSAEPAETTNFLNVVKKPQKVGNERFNPRTERL